MDSGSCKNMVSNVMVDKLNLNCGKNPYSYRISWVNKGIEVMTDKRYLMKFLISIM